MQNEIAASMEVGLSGSTVNLNSRISLSPDKASSGGVSMNQIPDPTDVPGGIATSIGSIGSSTKVLPRHPPLYPSLSRHGDVSQSPQTSAEAPRQIISLIASEAGKTPPSVVGKVMHLQGRLRLCFPMVLLALMIPSAD